MSIAMMLLAEAQNVPQPDYTPAVIGLLGTLVGAAIGLAFNFFSHRENKQRHINEKAVEFLRHTDAVRAAYRAVYYSSFDHDTGSLAVSMRRMSNGGRTSDAEQARSEGVIVLDYLGLTARRRTHMLAAGVARNCSAMVDHMRLHVTQGAKIPEEPLELYQQARTLLVNHLSPRPPALYGPMVLYAKFKRWAARRLPGDDLVSVADDANDDQPPTAN
ncbi:hypothetical protein ABIE37_000944 [Arthrobacter bambusae]|uniref:DUF4760 domain-containing protein n=1 Tax=Arthrobacter bambusae TaxID=1338426 RepID=A0ABV2P3K9_9MICC